MTDLTSEQQEILAELVGTLEWLLDRKHWGFFDYLYPPQQDLPLPWLINGLRDGTDEDRLLEVIAGLHAAIKATRDTADNYDFDSSAWGGEGWDDD